MRARNDAGVRQRRADIGKGLTLCREAAEAGNPSAQTDYGTFLLLGKGLSRDMVAAWRWFTAAASQKQANAAMLLGQMLWNGDGGAADPEASAKWLKVAYDNGRKDAAAFLARAAFKRAAPDGKVVDRSAASDAVHWLRIAAEEDPDPAKRADFAATVKDLGVEN
ncbi:sel1 repeat family protein [Sphingomonas sp. JC676]|uniref:tetratricopeptide repeat protein n=1 Tax=Sphingomonas sp. JC676 TaxID=2768065 RepID=UPI0016586351|nr:SEL1-like repeat protein [Sphingomonas sp. JC676]MBC9034396.1 sel1 repeat family protein [Sphingomonas sp. JC676]